MPKKIQCLQGEPANHLKKGIEKFKIFDQPLVKPLDRRFFPPYPIQNCFAVLY